MLVLPVWFQISKSLMGFAPARKYDTPRSFWRGQDLIHSERNPRERTTPNPTRFFLVSDVRGWGCTPQDRAFEYLRHRWYEKSIQRYIYSVNYPRGLPGGCLVLQPFFPNPHHPDIHILFSCLLIHTKGISPRSCRWVILDNGICTRGSSIQRS